MVEPLDDVAVRVLGSLIEKELTTPDNYPLTLNSLTAACNQTSNREPVMELDEQDVVRALDALAKRSLARAVKRNDSRVERYRHLMTETLHLHQQENALMCVLMLRGPQTTGELRTRTARMFDFRDLAHVEITLDALMTLSTPLLVRQPRQAGQKEVRYAHLLAGEPPPYVPDVRERQASSQPGRIEVLEQEMSSLRAEMAELRAQFEEFRKQFQ